MLKGAAKGIKKEDCGCDRCRGVVDRNGKSGKPRKKKKRGPYFAKGAWDI